jgi:hypothetical protein
MNKAILLVVCLFATPAHALISCDVWIPNVAGDRITGRLNIQFSEGNADFHNQTDAGETAIFDPPNPTVTPDRPYAMLGWTAAVANEHVTSRQTSGSNGWNCWFDNITVTHQAIMQDDAKKQAAKRDATVKALWAAGISGFGFSTVTRILCPAAGVVVCTTLYGVFGGIAIYGTNQARLAIDPPDPNPDPFYAEPNWDIENYFGLQWIPYGSDDPYSDNILAQYGNDLLSHAVMIEAYGIAIYTNTNRGQTALAQYYIGLMADELAAQSYDFVVLRWEFERFNWVPVFHKDDCNCDINLLEMLQQAADATSQSAQALKEIQ